MASSNYSLRLRYGALLLLLIRREGAWRTCADWQRVSNLCDRFERVMASVSRPTLVWEGDYA